MFNTVKIETLKEIELLITGKINETLLELESKKDSDDFEVIDNLISKYTVLNKELFNIGLKIEKIKQNKRLDALVTELENKYIFKINGR